jgi:hypothetical protein
MRVSGGTVSSGLSCAARILAAFRQKLHLFRCAIFQSQLSVAELKAWMLTERGAV